ncbi:Saccharolysin [Penicillium subrubescens]|uniref:Saccharolysin n=1 Tax=Penicillium subrubescens TaxID=1316194 RepID=A0A1Q5UMX9_9EURO|nr:Saccharolysin [Penicillium subrubescens]
MAVDLIKTVRTGTKQLLDKLSPRDATFENVILPMAKIDNDIKGKRLIELRVAFTENLSLGPGFTWKEEEDLEGLGAEIIQALPLRSSNGQRGVPLKKTYDAVLPSYVRSETRKEAFLQSQRIFAENVTVFEEIIILRDERARLLGFESYAHQQARSKLLKSPQELKTMLDEVSLHLLPIAQTELEALQRTKDPSGRLFYLWDFDYHHNKMLRDNYQVDHDLIAEYFPAKVTIQNMLSIFETILGLKVESLKCIRGDYIWHPEVKIFSIDKQGDFDNETGRVQPFHLQIHCPASHGAVKSMDIGATYNSLLKRTTLLQGPDNDAQWGHGCATTPHYIWGQEANYYSYL